MASAAAVLTNLGSDQWDAEVYAVISITSHLAALVKSRAQTIQLTYQLWRLNGKIGDFFKAMRDNMEGKNLSSSTPPPPVTPERLGDGIRGLRQAHVKIETLYEAARHARLTNNSLVAMPLRSLHTYGDEFLELAELLEAYQSPEG